ncbi:MAG: hypothetical protein J6Y60_03415 [Treponema sp.]|nr:hypothetical protein [Treponema sp.]
MKPTYKGYEGKRGNGFVNLPPVGAYVAEIQDVRFVKGENGQRDRIECFIEITEGEYKNRFHEVYKDQDEKWGNATYRGTFRLVPPVEGEEGEDWRKRTFESNLWCVEQSNAGYRWDWDEKKLKGKAVGISLRKRLYTGKDKDGNPVDRETVEIGRFEVVDEVRNGKCKPMRERDQREKDPAPAGTTGEGFTDVSNDNGISVPW